MKCKLDEDEIHQMRKSKEHEMQKLKHTVDLLHIEGSTEFHQFRTYLLTNTWSKYKCLEMSRKDIYSQ